MIHPVKRAKDHKTIMIEEEAIPPCGTINSYEDDESNEFGDGLPVDSLSTKRKAGFKRFKPNPPAKIEIAPIANKPVHQQSAKIEPKLSTKPPLPPKSVAGGSKMKQKVDDNNACLVQKLAAQAEQLRLELSEVKVALSLEKNAVRVLR